MNILGVSCFYHDSAACLVRDGEVVSAAQEERFSRIKNTDVFPIEAINFCVQKAGIGFHEIDHVIWFEKPYLKFSRVLTAHLQNFPFSAGAFVRSMPRWLSQRLFVPMLLEEKIDFTKETYFIKHHHSHAASAFFPSGFDEANILVADGVGEWATFSTGVGRGNSLRLTKEIHYPDSLGLLYSAFTTFLGFHANGGEGKLMGLAGFGEPAYLSQIKKMVKVYPDGSFLLDRDYFRFLSGKSAWTKKFTNLVGVPRHQGEELTQRHFDLAASVQKMLEDILLNNVRLLHKETGLRKLCLAGGVALNCVANARILEETPISEIFIQPAAGDAGGALGAALYFDHVVRKIPARKQTHAYLGPDYTDNQILKVLNRRGIPFREFSEHELTQRTASLLHQNKIVGWFQGSMEFGPRALGNRSILANPTNPLMKDILNEHVKKRESFRPYAPIVLSDQALRFFRLQGESPFMLLAPKMTEEGRKLLPGVLHADGTARVQTCRPDVNPLFCSLLRSFESLSGVPVLINTSFNRKDEPVVNTPEEAIDCFLRTGMDALAIGKYLLEKEELQG